MNAHEDILERMNNANPLPDTEMITDGQLAEMTLQVEEQRRAAIGGAPSPSREPAPAPRRTQRRWLRPAMAFAAACLLVLGTVGIVALVQTDQPDESDVGEAAPPTTTIGATPTAYTPDINRVFDIAVAPNGTLWTATLGGLVHWDVASETPTVYTTEQGLPAATIRRVVVAEDGAVWVGGAGWLARFDGAWAHTFSAPRDSDGPLAVDPNGAVWVAFGEYELGRFDGAAWTYYQTPLSWPDDTVGGPWTTSLAFAPDGTAWLGANDFDGAAFGVFSFLPVDDPGVFGEAWTHYAPDEELPEGLGDSVVVAPDGTVWVGSNPDRGGRGNGVASFDGTTWTAYTTTDGLPPGWLQVVVGSDGSAWAVSESGVALFEGTTWWTHPELSSEQPGAAVDQSGVLWLPAPEADGGGIIGFDGGWPFGLAVPVDVTATTVPVVVDEPTLLPTDVGAEAPPFTGTCPAGTNPNAPGPAGQERPASDWTSVQAAAFDTSIGRIIYVDTLGETWTFDVCTNTWHRMNPTGAMLGDLSGGLVYDVDSQVTVALGWDSISVYDAATNAWTQPENTAVNVGAPFGGVYDPISGLIITTAYRGREGSTTDAERLEAWSYDVDTNAWALLETLWTGEDGGVLTEIEEGGLLWSDLLGYSPELDRFIFANPENVTVLVDLRTGSKTKISTKTPAVSFGWPKAQYGQAAGTAFVARGVETTSDMWVDAFDDQICGFDPQTQAWTTCFLMPGGRKYAAYGAMIGDPVNNRLVLIHGIYGNWWVNSDDAVWAIDLDTGETTELLAESD